MFYVDWEQEEKKETKGFEEECCKKFAGTEVDMTESPYKRLSRLHIPGQGLYEIGSEGELHRANLHALHQEDEESWMRSEWQTASTLMVII